MLSGSMVIAKSMIGETKIIQKAFEISIQILYLIFDYPYNYCTFKHFEV